MTDGKRLREELDAVARQGYAVDNEEITRGLVCVAAPIFGVDGSVQAAISCTVSSFDADDRYLETVKDQVIACAERASG